MKFRERFRVDMTGHPLMCRECGKFIGYIRANRMAVKSLEMNSKAFCVECYGKNYPNEVKPLDEGEVDRIVEKIDKWGKEKGDDTTTMGDA